MATASRSITVHAPLRSVYNQWTQFEQFPQFMEGVRSVQQIDDTTLRWTAQVAGKEASWTSRITEQVPDHVVAWQSSSGKLNHGRVLFSPNGADQTTITAVIEYDPEGIVENVADALGFVERRLKGDLERFRNFIERLGHKTGGWRGEVHVGKETSGA